MDKKFSVVFFAVNIFGGTETGVETSQLYTAEYSCDFDMVMFPFDVQVPQLITHFTGMNSRTNEWNDWKDE